MTRAATPRPAYREAMTFCRVHLGRDCFAPHTGQDMSGWIAFVYLVEMWCRADQPGRDAAIDAMRAVLSGVQRKADIHQTFLQAIPALGDWPHVDEIWPQLGSPFTLCAVGGES